MKQKIGLIVLLAAFAILVGVAVSFAVASDNKAAQGPPPAPVEVAPVTEEMVSEQVTLVGTTEPKIKSIIAAEVEGLVKSFPVKEGDYVKKGAVLVRLRSTNLNIRLKAALAAKEEAKARYRFAKEELARSEKLKDANSIAAKRYDQTLYEFQALEQQVLRYEAEIEELKDSIRKKKVIAPFSGFIAEEHTEVGEWIKKGGKVVTLIDLSLIRITVDLPERYIMEIRPDSAVQVMVSAYSMKPVSGTISAILPEGHPDSRTFPVRLDVPNRKLKLKSGMEARVVFNLGTKTKAMLVPKDAVVTANGGRLVFVVNSGTAHSVNIKIIGTYGVNVAVDGLLKPGDRVVIRGNERLRPGQHVTVVQ
ncbi:MAG: efflux RND transporter periplasmic adaptor subunit [Deltaproteobacteria bacterium]|nr:efflux RND transporter periplasmic adaptor subunit [Deltaproteobacteria bacterium]